MVRGLVRVLGFLGGFVAGWSAAMAFYIASVEAGLMVDRDGGKAMAFAFMIGPFLGVLGGVIAVVWLSRRAARRAG